MARRDGDGITLLNAIRHPEGDAERVELATSGGTIPCRLQDAEGDAAVSWVFGAGAGPAGPAGGVCHRLGGRLAREGVASLEPACRRPTDLVPCILDALSWTRSRAWPGSSRWARRGSSLWGIPSGARWSSTRACSRRLAVAALSGQTAGTAAVGRLAPKPALFVHGEADEVLPAACSLDLHARARHPKRLILHPGCRHGLDECRDALDGALRGWKEEVLGR